MNDGAEMICQVLDFWFGTKESEEYGGNRKAWWVKDPSFDAEIRHRFLAGQRRAAKGEYDFLAESPQGMTALVIMLDQFPRNLYRDSLRAFATDARALALTKRAVDTGMDKDLIPAMRLFLYLPLEHSEDLEDQERSVALYKALDFADTYDFAVRHRNVVARFGRFPHRNNVLGRKSTVEEIEFLKQPGSSF